MSATTKMIEKYCERTGSEFIGYKNGFYEFKALDGIIYAFTQSTLRKTVRNL